MKEVTKFLARWNKFYSASSAFKELVMRDKAYDWAVDSAILQDLCPAMLNRVSFACMSWEVGAMLNRVSFACMSWEVGALSLSISLWGNSTPTLQFTRCAGRVGGVF